MEANHHHVCILITADENNGLAKIIGEYRLGDFNIH